MKLKEVDRNGNVAWSPLSCDSTYLAVGTASQQLDLSFSTNAQLEIFKYVPNQKNWEMPISASVPSESKFSKLLWGNAQHNNGFIVGGTENGAISIYDASLLLKNGKSSNSSLSRVAIRKEHKSSVNAMDFNKFKPNLLATGSSDSDIFIWDLDKLEDPMTPGTKTQPLEDILSLAWNHKVQHILASTSVHRCQIWDLRKSDPVIKLSDSQMKMKCKKVVWHPDISTRLCVSSEDDHTPIMQLWDLRYLQCPLHTLQKHIKGIVDMDWCLDDPDLLISVGKDRQMIGWNMSTHSLSATPDSSSDVIYEWQLDQEWVNEARFCPKHPGIVSVSSFDCHIGVYSLLGGRGHVPRELSETVTDSFPLDLCNDDGQENEIVKKEAEKAAELQLAPTPSLLKAPKWLKRPIGAHFSFGGKLVQFYKSEGSRSRNNSESQVPSTSPNDGQYKIIISQVVTDQCLIQGSNVLVKATESSDSLLHYCQNKVQTITNEIVDMDHGHSKSELLFDRNLWKFIECHYEEDSRSAFMNNLGYSESNVRNMGNISNPNHNFLTEDINDDHIVSDSDDNILSLHNLELLPQHNETENILSVALMTGNIDTAINICLQQNRTGEAAVLAVSSGRQDLYEKVQNKILQAASKTHPTALLISVAVKRNWYDLVENCDLKDWREALAWLLTYVSAEELGELCEILGRRLEERSRSGDEFLFASCICYICSGSIGNFVRCWINCKSLKSNYELQRLVEMVILLCKSIGDEEFSLIKGEAAHIVTRYASLIASQGNLLTALTYLGDNDDHNVLALRHRICQHLRDHQLPPGIKKPEMPFKISPIVNIMTRASFNGSSQNKSSFKQLQHESGVYSNPRKVSDLPAPVGIAQMKIADTTKSISTFNDNRYAKNMPVNPPSSNNIPANFCPPSSLPGQMNNYARPNPVYMAPVLSQSDKRPNIYTTPVPISSQMSSIIPQANLVPGSMKPSWNDPPLLSENYRRMHIENKIASDNYELLKAKKGGDVDQEKSESNVQQLFYNPVNFASETSDISSFGNQLSNINQSGHVQSPYISDSNQAISNTTNQPAVETSNGTPELSSDKQHWKMSFESLVELCKQRDNSRQTKVKMDDIQKKIDHWFSQLKIKPVSPELLIGLESLVALIDSNDFKESFDKVNQIMQTVNFSEAGSFLPSLKMLIQYAIRLSG